jgi:hypothetical protein
METRDFGGKDRVTRLQEATLELLTTEVVRWRKSQLFHKRQKTPLDPDFAETVGMLSRSVSTLTAELRKSGKDMRDAGTKLTTDQRVAAVVEFLRDLPPARRAEVLASFGEAVADG